jgi:uncharacterized coiled-coil protein SlyX
MQAHSAGADNGISFPGATRYTCVMDAESDTRLEQVESTLAHLEHQYDQLNQIVIRQEKQIAKLLSVIDRVDNTLRDFEINQVRDNNPRPPHYGGAPVV